MKFKKEVVIVDLGTHTGCSALAFAGGVGKQGMVHTVDRFNDKKVYKEALDNLKVVNNVVIHVGEFSEVAKTFDRPIDILHIDGGHEYDEVSQDCQDWIPKIINENGVILMHDIWNLRYPNVLKVFMENVGGYKVAFLEGLGLGIATANPVLIQDIYRGFNARLVAEPVLNEIYDYVRRMHKWSEELLESSVQEKAQKDSKTKISS